MNINPNPSLLGKLARQKLMTRWQAATMGVGERRSKSKGAGMEFADHREYQPGDDFRHLDAHVHARTGKNYVKQYDVYQQLPVIILIDSSRSMADGDPSKFAYACKLAAALAFTAVAGGDVVQFGVGTGEKIAWSPRFSGVARAQRLFDWLGKQTPTATGSFAETLRASTRTMANRGLVIAISDFWADSVDSELALLSATGQELWGFHVLSPAEVDPTQWGEGEVRMVDSESGHEVELSLDRPTIERYRRNFEAWRENLTTLFTRDHGRYLLVQTNQDLDKLFLQDWRSLGLIA